MPDIQGTVTDYKVVNRVSKKTGRPFTLYNLVVDGEYYSFGFNAPNPTPQVGDVVKVRFDEVQNGQYTNRNVQQFRVVTPAADNPNKGNAVASSGGGGNQNLGMAWGNASNVAATLVAKMAEVDALPLTQAKGKANSAKRFEEFLEIFDKLRVKLYKDALDPERVIEQHADFGEVEEHDPPALPDTDEEESEEEGGDDEWDDDAEF